MFNNEGVAKKVKIGVVLVIVLVVLFVWLFVPTGSIINFIAWIGLILFILLILSVCAYIFYLLFLKPQKVDITYITKQKIIESAKISKPPEIGDLFLSGDSKHSSVRLGKIIGWCQIQIYKPIKTSEDGSKVVEEDVIAEDVFVVEKAGFPFNFFADPYVVRIDPSSHTDLIGDVYVKGFSLTKIAEYYYLNVDHLNVGKIDYNIWREGDRGVNKLVLADWKQIVDNAIGINPTHNLAMEREKLLKIPQSPPQGRPEV